MRNSVQERADRRCEYCGMRQEFDELPLQIEHIIAKKHHGSDDFENLALACFACNNHKGPNLSGIDPETGEITRLFHPRTDDWSTAFEMDGAKIVGKSPIGRATVDVLAMNLSYRVELRRALIDEGVYP